MSRRGTGGMIVLAAGVIGMGLGIGSTWIVLRVIKS